MAVLQSRSLRSASDTGGDRLEFRPKLFPVSAGVYRLGAAGAQVVASGMGGPVLPDGGEVDFLIAEFNNQ